MLFLSQAFFRQLSLRLTASLPAQLATLSLLLAFLSRPSTPAYHALKSDLVSNLIQACLTSPSPANVALGIKSLVIFLVSLPVLVGEAHLLGIKAVYGRALCWGQADEDGQSELDHGTLFLRAPPQSWSLV